MKTTCIFGRLFIIMSLKMGIVSSLIPLPWENRNIPILWVDNRYRADAQVDTFFDRLVMVYKYEPIVDGIPVEETCTYKATGVFLTTELILSSFNALRNISGTQGTLKKMRFCHMYGRKHFSSTGAMTYIFDRLPGQIPRDNGREIVCGRQVIPSDPNGWPIHMRHGPNIPVHDLMVIRIKIPIKFVNPIPPVVEGSFDFQTWTPDKNDYTKTGFSPIRTILAKPGDKMYREEMRFVSVGHLSDEHIELNGFVEKGEFGDVVDCEEWLPREWGHFICLQNTENYPGLAAGAMLYSGEQLFGVGAFMLKKGKDSILVFTDVRPYWHLMYRTCSKDDQNLATNPPQG